MKAQTAPSTAPREWTIYVCDRCGKTSTDIALCCVIERKAGKVTYGPRKPVEVVERASLDRVVEERDELKKALEVAADDLGKAANQFASMRESQRAGYSPSIQSNPEKFEQKEARARAALRSGEGERHEG